ncbi:hypothetical protein [Magnetovibrio sp.]|uniref:hypothetical protein n=1 Tax=Magnetovibrio sp. TaxID=2024836 RepID=UPI002F95CA6D
MPATIRTILQAAILATTALTFSADALAISQSCKGQTRPDRSATDAFFKDFVPHYTMGECMVRLKLDVHENVKKASAVYQIGKEFRRYLYAHAPTAAAYYFEPGRDGYHYLMYVNECPNRYAITQAMIDAVQPCFEGEVDIKMLEGPVEPGPQTFEPTTMEWTDSIPE